MKNIVFLNTCPVWGGGEKWTFTTAKILNEDPEFNVYIATGSDTELFKRAEKAGIKTKEVKVKSGITVLNLFKVFRFKNFLKEKDIDILFLNMSQDLKFGGITGKLASLDRIIYRRGSAIPIKDRFYNKYLLTQCVTDVIANSKATKETILRNTSHWLNEDKIELIYNGIDLDKVDKALENPVDISQEFGIADNKKIIGNIGRLSYQKGHEFLIEAVELLKQERNDFVVLIIGDGERKKELKNLVKEKELDDYIIFTGFRDDVYNLLPGLDFLVHTARWEGFGFVIAEAMAAGIPVVSTDVSNISEIVVDGKSGYLAKAEDVEDIKEKIFNLMQSDYNLKNKMGNNGRNIIENKFSIDLMINKLKLFLKGKFYVCD
ncbi:glycosyltransferase involved in cell wall biosynthesis [Halanaerobium saccharolyticum]|uniref:Glycosyltransferase involved in cell wall biosynthesis n=1 Tax=Halanaerobium saccharolyticum TaxID=43595 RepID=A0A4V3G618_9FIRM|nr:glycosyltransferase [Halanaerobium saccharolyticum]RAK11938.1 glycosyltransferase involved in cell wall biosynthesis [Halanaerobium saccharolyticum]TDW07779.1 glycosyltransferase involved in cell wall biosynthesis [Halanaerobium saccharolyticum]TDX64700.1 glycosyltransferase involved in cell wall biosynthesis [Halanaerobium saccharolyticum]